ncbi:MAG: sulfatase family protein [Aureliella sp.]
MMQLELVACIDTDRKRKSCLIDGISALRAPRLQLLVFAMVGLAMIGLGVSESQAQDLPNVVLILADDLGYGDVRCLNSESKIPTPNLDGLAAAGATFTDAHSPAAVCTPTRYALLTGRYCWRSRLKRGVLGGYSEPLLEDGRPTMATMLKHAGYNTGAIGKWHLGMQLPMLDAELGDKSKWNGDPGVDFEGEITNGPLQHGFDTYFGVTASLDMAPYVFVRDSGFTAVPTIQQKAVKFPHFVRSGPRSADFIIDEVLDRLTEEAMAFVAEQSKKDSPYFLYMPLTGPHKPTQPHERFKGKTSLSEYGDFVHQVDWTVGEVLKAVEATGESENTLVIFSSDNGSYMYRYADPGKEDHVDNVAVQGFKQSRHRANGPLRGTKADVYEAGHRVPCFVRWPAQIEAGKDLKTVVCLTDIYATLAEVVGQSLGDSEAEDSVSLVSLFDQSFDDTESERTARGAPVINHSGSGMFAIRDGRWKLICGNGSGGREQPKGKPFTRPFQLYDLASDLAESNDLAGKYPERVESMYGVLEKLRESGRSAGR